MRRAARVDENQPIIVEALRAGGASIVHLHQLGQGIPDILVGAPGVTIVGHVSEELLELIRSIDGLIIHHGANLLIEIKPPGGDLTDDEAKFLEEYRGQMTVVFSAEEALELIGR
jgi:hypothetical protein